MSATLKQKSDLETKVEWGGVRVTRLEITGLDKDVKRRWRALCEYCQQVENTLWEQWLVWHVNNGTRDILDSWLKACREWHEMPKKERPKKKPKLDATAMPKGLDKTLWQVISRRFPQVNTRTLTLIQNVWRGTLTSRKSANGNLSGWINILLNRESIPSATKPLPIPFDTKNSDIVPPAEHGGNFKLSVRLWRLPDETKKNSPSIKDEYELWTKGRKRNSQSQILWRCVSGEYKFCGSSIQFKDGKVYALICYRMPQRKVWLNPECVAIASPAIEHPISLKFGPKWKRKPGGYGRDVGAIRKQCMLQRISRQSCYRNAGSSNKGHGRNRAIQGVAKLSNRWKNYTKRWNHSVCTDIVQQCVGNGCGTLVWFKPTDANRDRLFLSTAGATGRDNSSWDYFQIESFLKYRCEREGIALIVHE